MSSSDRADRMHATPWALDELDMPDIFGMPEDHVSREQEVASLQDVLAADRSRAEAEAYARGHADAERTMRARIDADLGAAMTALREAAAAVQLHEARWVANAEENIAALATAVARHIVQHEVSVDPTVVRSLVTRALVQLPVDQSITVRLHPEDIAACESLITPDAKGRTPDVRWAADANILRGGCLVEGRERIIDGRVDTALERTYRSIAGLQA